MSNRPLAVSMLLMLGFASVAWKLTSPGPATERMKWEYKYARITEVEVMGANNGTVVIGTNNGTEVTVIQLNRFGDDGWELVSMQPARDASDVIQITDAADAKELNEAFKGADNPSQGGSVATTQRQFDCYFKRQK